VTYRHLIPLKLCCMRKPDVILYRTVPNSYFWYQSSTWVGYNVLSEILDTRYSSGEKLDSASSNRRASAVTRRLYNKHFVGVYKASQAAREHHWAWAAFRFPSHLRHLWNVNVLTLYWDIKSTKVKKTYIILTDILSCTVSKLSQIIV